MNRVQMQITDYVKHAYAERRWDEAVRSLSSRRPPKAPEDPMYDLEYSDPLNYDPMDVHYCNDCEGCRKHEGGEPEPYLHDYVPEFKDYHAFFYTFTVLPKWGEAVMCRRAQFTQMRGFATRWISFVTDVLKLERTQKKIMVVLEYQKSTRNIHMHAILLIKKYARREPMWDLAVQFASVNKDIYSTQQMRMIGRHNVEAIQYLNTCIQYMMKEVPENVHDYNIWTVIRNDIRCFYDCDTYDPEKHKEIPLSVIVH